MVMAMMKRFWKCEQAFYGVLAASSSSSFPYHRLTPFPNIVSFFTTTTTTTATPQPLNHDDKLPTVSVFWDLDNKPPIAVPPFMAAQRLKEMASRFGRVMDMVAYANRHAFSYLPRWVQDERRERKLKDELEVKGLVKVEEPYICGYCGRKCRNNVALQKHFRQLHERERNKRMNRLQSLKGKRREQFREVLQEKEKRYKEAARSILVPQKGYGLAWELRRAGVFVRTVSDKPQSADAALKDHILQSICRGVGWICLVSDDSDFMDVFDLAKEWEVQTVLVGENKKLRKLATICYSWEDVASGLPLVGADSWSDNKEYNDCYDLEISNSSLGNDFDYDSSHNKDLMPIHDDSFPANIWLHDDLSSSDSDEIHP